jgi:hypothetical protein
MYCEFLHVFKAKCNGLFLWFIYFVLFFIGQNPRILQDIWYLNPFLKIFFQHRGNKFLNIFGSLIPNRIIEAQRLINNLLHDNLMTPSQERCISREQNIENNAKWPNIALIIIEFIDHFRSEIVNLSNTNKYSSSTSPFFRWFLLKFKSRAKIKQLQWFGIFIK